MLQALWCLISVNLLLFHFCVRTSNATPSVTEPAGAALLNGTAPTKTLVKRPYSVQAARICDKMYGIPNFWDCDKALLAIPTPNAAEAVRQRRFRTSNAELATDMPNEDLPQKWGYGTLYTQLSSKNTRTCIIEIATLSSDEHDTTWDIASWRSLRGVSRQINNNCVWGRGSGGMQKAGVNSMLSSTVYSTISDLAEGGGVEGVRTSFGRSATSSELMDAITAMLTSDSQGEPRATLQGLTIEEVLEPSAPPMDSCAARYCVPGMGRDCCQGWTCVWNNIAVASTALMLGSKGLDDVAEVGWCDAAT
ncbi:MAG: hypothetical protein M1812_001345 [Candelaria pacifica]|nr:MAG: hypothetical protein M1812_001345 [Candelaria pacifica]